jgi:hypothetical protein
MKVTLHIWRQSKPSTNCLLYTSRAHETVY